MTLIGRSSTGPTTRRTKAGDLLENHQMDNLLEDQQQGTFWKIINLTIYSNSKFDDLRNHQIKIYKRTSYRIPTGRTIYWRTSSKKSTERPSRGSSAGRLLVLNFISTSSEGQSTGYLLGIFWWIIKNTIYRRTISLTIDCRIIIRDTQKDINLRIINSTSIGWHE